MVRCASFGAPCGLIVRMRANQHRSCHRSGLFLCSLARTLQHVARRLKDVDVLEIICPNLKDKNRSGKSPAHAAIIFTAYLVGSVRCTMRGYRRITKDVNMSLAFHTERTEREVCIKKCLSSLYQTWSCHISSSNISVTKPIIVLQSTLPINV